MRRLLTAARSRVIPVVVGLAVGLVVVSGPDALGAKGCPAGQVRQTVAYVKHAGGAVKHATGCVPRTLTPPTSVIASLSALHASAFKLVPASVARALRSRAARRVLSASHATDETVAAT